MGCHALHQWDLSDPGVKSASLMSPALPGRFFTTSATWEACQQPHPFETTSEMETVTVLILITYPCLTIYLTIYSPSAHQGWGKVLDVLGNCVSPLPGKVIKPLFICISAWHWCTESQDLGNIVTPPHPPPHSVHSCVTKSHNHLF